MANKLYEEEEVRQIAVSLRANAPRKIGQRELLLSEMSSSVDDVYLEGYENGSEHGYNLGIIDGEEKVKTEEARTGADVATIVEVPTKNVEVSVAAGYYGQETVVNVGVTDVYTDGLTKGSEQGYGYGYEDGHNEGYNEGYGEGYNDGYDQGHSDGYDDGLAAGGGGGGDEPYDPTTVWLLNDVLVSIGSGVQGTTIDVPFVSAGEEFVKITHTALALNYYRSDGTIEQAWSSRKGWTSDEYKTITFPDEITDETLQTWLDTNATLISGGGGGGGEDASLPPLMMDQIHSSEIKYVNLVMFYYPPESFGRYGEPFEDLIEYEISSASSNPITVSVNNYTNYYAYVGVNAEEFGNSEEYVGEICVPPNGSNSVHFVSQLQYGNPPEWDITILGARFTVYEL